MKMMSVAVSRPIEAEGHLDSRTLVGDQIGSSTGFMGLCYSLSHPAISMDHASVWSILATDQIMKLEFCSFFDPFQNPEVLFHDVVKVLQDVDECAVGDLVLESLHVSVVANLASEDCLFRFCGPFMEVT